MPPYTCSERGRGAYLFGQLHRRGVRQNFYQKTKKGIAFKIFLQSGEKRGRNSISSERDNVR